MVADSADGADDKDLHAQRTMSLASGLQGKRDVCVAKGKRRLVQKGHTPEQHVAMAMNITSPLVMPVPSANDLEFALQTCVKEGANIRSWRQARFRELAALVKKPEALGAEMDALRSESSKAVSQHLKPEAIEALRLLICWPDEGSANSIVKGSEIVGEIPPTGVFRGAKAADSTCIHSICSGEAVGALGNDEWAKKLLKNKPPDVDERIAVWMKSEEERVRGTIEGWYTKEGVDAIFGVNRWRAMKRFGIFQENNGEWRTIDNGRSSMHNTGTSATERISTTSVETGYAVYRRFADIYYAVHGCLPSFKVTTKDMKRAYRQLAPHEDHLHMSVICIWSLEHSCWMFGILHGLAFGLSGAVLQFNRHPPLLVAVARRILAIPVISFFDDFKITELVAAMGSGAHYFDKLVELTGWSFDPKKDKTESPATFLGTVEDFSSSQNTGIITVSPKALRLQGAIKRIDAALPT